jgi:putative addiction module component (TIGR02574 family)
LSLLSDRQIKSLPVSERIFLAERLWQSIPENSEELALSTDQKKELIRRLDSLEKGHAKTTTWKNVRTKMRASRSCK